VQIGKYDVIGQVGAGSTGVVWLATQPEVDRPVAIKQLAADLATDTSFRDRFRAEAQVLASLSTPNVVAVYDYVEAPDGAYIVEEYVDGASLARVVAEAGRLSPEQAVGVTRGALRGLADAHDVDLVHGDVTPANILVAQDGTSKLIDFGLSVSSGSTGSSGTPAYASPEAITGRPLDARSDVYSAGCVLFELLAGEAPFSGGTPAEIAARHTAAEPPALPGTHTGLAHVVGRAMANDPAARYPNAREFLTALEDQAQHDLGASWELTASIAGLTLAAALTTTAVTGASAAATTPSVTTTASASRTTAKTAARGLRRIPKKWAIAGGATAAVAVVVIAAVALTGGNTNPDLSGKWNVKYTTTNAVSGGQAVGTFAKFVWNITCNGGRCSAPYVRYGKSVLHLTENGKDYTGTVSTLQRCPAGNGIALVEGAARIDNRLQLTVTATGGNKVTKFQGTDVQDDTTLKPSSCTIPADHHFEATLAAQRAK
jgi:eukaryotic-like serine/threonine-protein kinase